MLIRLRGRAEDAVDGGRNRWPGVDLRLIDAVGGFQSIRIKPPLERDEAKGRDDQDPRRDPASIAHWPPCRTERAHPAWRRRMRDSPMRVN